MTPTWKGTALVCLLALGCGHAPTNTQEYRALIREHPTFTDLEEVELRVPYRKVYANLQEFSGQCLNGEVYAKTGAYSGAYHRLQSRLVAVAPAKAELSMTIDGGYWLVTDVESAGAQSTRLTIYTQHKPYAGFVADWASGTSRKCPY